MKYWFCCAALSILTACSSDGVTRPPPTTVGFFNAAPNTTFLNFYREANQQASLSFQQGLSVTFDSGPYDFAVEYQALPNSPLRYLTRSVNLDPSFDYLFIGTAQTGDPEYFIVPRADTVLTASESRVTVINALPNRGAFDVYVEAAGTLLSSVAPFGQVDFGPNAASGLMSPGTNRIFLTTPGDPNDLLFETENIDIAGGGDYVFIIYDPGEIGTAEIAISALGASSVRIREAGAGGAVRLVQTIDDRLPRDVYLNDTLSAAVFPNLGHGVFTGDVDIEAIGNLAIVTPVATPGTVEASAPFSVTPNTRFTGLFAGNTTDGIRGQLIVDDRRSILDLGMLRILNGAGILGTLEIYVLQAGEDYMAVDPAAVMPAPGFTDRIQVPPGDWEILVNDPVTATVVAGPLPVTIEGGGVYGILVTDSAAGSTADIILYDDFVP